MSLTRDLVRLVRAKGVTEGDLGRAALLVLDTLACAMGALATPPAGMLQAVAPPDRGDTARRAFVMGGLSHILELDDLHRDSVTHPGCVVIPAAWAVAEDRDLGGRPFLEAILAGYEACCRVGMAVGREHYRIWHNTATCGPFGSAMAVARLLELGEDQSVSALGNAGTQSSGLWEFLDEGAMSKHLHTARAAESGVLAALLAEQGLTGPERILEGPRGFFAGLCPHPLPEAIVAGPGRPWELARTSVKPWPCCRHTHPAIDAALELNSRLASVPIAKVTARTYRAALDVCDRPRPQDAYGAKFSLQHCVAIALADGKVDQSSFDAAARERLAAERARVSVELSPEIEAAYPGGWGAEIVVETTDGRRLTAFRREAKGDPENPVTAAELAAKARGLLLEGGMDDAGADLLIKAILDLTNDRPVRSLGLFPGIRHGRSASTASWGA